MEPFSEHGSNINFEKRDIDQSSTVHTMRSRVETASKLFPFLDSWLFPARVKLSRLRQSALFNGKTPDCPL
jgi:hypothetical protein